MQVTVILILKYLAFFLILPLNSGFDLFDRDFF